MVIIWLMMVNNHLVGGISENMKVKWDDYSMWKNKIHVPKHQPVIAEQWLQ